MREALACTGKSRVVIGGACTGKSRQVILGLCTGKGRTATGGSCTGKIRVVILGLCNSEDILRVRPVNDRVASIHAVVRLL